MERIKINTNNLETLIARFCDVLQGQCRHWSKTCFMDEIMRPVAQIVGNKLFRNMTCPPRLCLHTMILRARSLMSIK